MGHPILRPRRRSLTWVWVTTLLLAVAALIAFALLRLQRMAESPTAGVDQQPASTGVAAAPQDDEQVVDDVVGGVPPPVLPRPTGAPQSSVPVRARIEYVQDEGDERRVNLVGCGFASGVPVGERATLGDGGIHLEITRLRDDSRCVARTSATPAELEGFREVVFRAGRPEPSGH
jgi:hypothetical protein